MVNQRTASFVFPPVLQNIDMLSSELEKYTKADASSKGEDLPLDQPVEPAEDPLPDSGAN